MKPMRGVGAIAALVIVCGTTFAENRSFDGSGNNLTHLQMGASFTALARCSPSAYQDNIGAPSGWDRPNPRAISNTVIAQSGSIVNNRGLSDWIWQWGQFIDHDLDLVDPISPSEPMNIPVPKGDPIFDPGHTGTQTIPFNRSAYVAGSGIDSPRQQMTSLTSWVDASQVYGSTSAQANALRSFSGGRMLTSSHSTGDLLPMSAGMFQAGDGRVNEQLGLTSVHTLFVREHNRWADALAASNPSWNDDQVFEAARKIVGAQMQDITYNEWIPALTGSKSLPEYSGYDSKVDASVMNEFASALFRVGHTMLSPELQRIDNSGNSIPQGPISLQGSFFNPSAILDEGGVDPLLKGLASQAMQEVDAHVVEDVRSFLFTIPGGGLDLPALNIQRARDHGIADYNTVREAYGLSAVTSFDQITSDTAVAASLREAYGTDGMGNDNVQLLDLWVGAIAEDHLPGSSLGALITAAIVDQFGRARDGDRFWYQNDLALAQVLDTIGMTVNDLESLSLADIIRSNTSIQNIQDNVFFVPAPGVGVFAMAGVFAARRRRSA